MKNINKKGFSKIGKILLIILGVLVLAFVGLVIYEIIHPSPGSPPEVILPTLSESPLDDVKKPAPCLFTKAPEEAWPNETASDPPMGNVELIKNLHIETYDTFGSNLLEVQDSMKKKGLVVRAHEAAIATVFSSIGITWQPGNTAAGCIITKAKVKLNITLTLPEWVNKAAASDQDQKMWDLYLKFTKQHEQGHINMALKEARELQAEVAQQTSAPSCQELTNKIKALFVAEREKRAEVDANYDNRTRSGSAQIPHEANQTRYVLPFTCDWSAIKI